jgi:hypothetical protein
MQNYKRDEFFHRMYNQLITNIEIDLFYSAVNEKYKQDITNTFLP